MYFTQELLYRIRKTDHHNKSLDIQWQKCQLRTCFLQNSTQIEKFSTRTHPIDKRFLFYIEWAKWSRVICLLLNVFPFYIVQCIQIHCILRIDASSHKPSSPRYKYSLTDLVVRLALPIQANYKTVWCACSGCEASAHKRMYVS